MNLFRNKEVKLFLFLYLIFTVVASVVAAFINVWAAILVVVICAISFLLFVVVIGFVALAYYLGGKKICNMNLVEAIKDDSLSM